MSKGRSEKKNKQLLSANLLRERRTRHNQKRKKIKKALNFWKKESLSSSLSQRQNVQGKTEHKSNRVINFLREGLVQTQQHTSFTNRVTIEIPESFSLIDNPVETLQKLQTIREATCNPAIKEFIFDHRKCKFLELGASIAMDSMVLSAKNNRNLIIRGFAPTDPHVKEVFYYTGLYKSLGLDESPLRLNKHLYKRFNLVHGRAGKVEATKSTLAEKVQSDLTVYFNDLLIEFGYELTNTAKAYLTQLVGEVIDNAEQHSEVGEWFIIGYLDKEKNICNIAILNYGLTICESLKRGTNSSTSLSILQLFGLRDAKRQLVKNLFEQHEVYYGSDYSENEFWTVLALQEGVSRFNINADSVPRGFGTVRMIEFFQELSGSIKGDDLFDRPHMVLLSGTTMIRFDGTYLTKPIKFGNEVRNIIAFNEDNSLSLKPDHNFVVKMKTGFPGTILTMRFVMDKDYYNSIASKD
jgi:hypothetical protein